jgi:serine/threonine protein kinase
VLEGGKTGGRVFLVDFGGVQAAAAGESFGMGSTVIGTYGFMAPEQFRGAAMPASDLYSLGGTLLYLLTGVLQGFPESCTMQPLCTQANLHLGCPGLSNLSE